MTGKQGADAGPAGAGVSGEAAEQQRALEIAESTFGNSSMEAAAVLVKLGGSHQRGGRLREAHRAYVRALEIMEEVLGPEDANLAIVYHQLAELELTRGRFVTGEPYARRSLEIEERSAGTSPAGLAERMRTLAALLAGQGRSPESQDLLCRADSLAVPGASGPDGMNSGAKAET